MKPAQPASSFWYQFFTLKRRIIIIFFSSSVLMFLCIGLISYYTINAILNNKIRAGVESNLKQIQLALLSNFANLNHVSQMMGAQGVVGSKLLDFYSTTEPYERSRLTTEMKAEMNIITFTNPSIGLVTYYFSRNHTFLLENGVFRETFNPYKLPLIASYYQINYYGPHISQDKYNNQYVLSALRKINLPDHDDAYIYMETGFKLTQNILDTDRTGIKAAHLMLDNDGRVAYSEVPAIFPINSAFAGGGNNKNLSGLFQEYFWFKAISNQGWSVVSVIPVAEYNRERDQWVSRMALLLVVFLAINLLLSLLLWDFVYRPLDKFDKELRWIESGNYAIQAPPTRIPEFDELLDKFQHMKKQILDLIKEVQEKEKRRADLEIEKLLYQINPHFLMNTLNTAHWLAVMNNQSEIDRIVQTLIKLLSYNLGKTGRTTTIGDEIDALQQYMVLQQIRHEFQFEIRILTDSEVLKTPIPRFILQPIVENSIYHGVPAQGLIYVSVERREMIEISISDNGAGMTVARIQELLNKEQVEQEKVGMGIGMNYVRRMLESHYGDQAQIQIDSQPGKGTTVRLLLPVIAEG